MNCISEKDNILINKNNFLTTLVWSGLLDRAKCGELARAIDLCIVEQEPCEDCISRQAAIYVASGFCHPSNVAKELAKLPSVTPKQKTEFIPKSVIEDIKSEIRSIQPKWHENAGKHNCIDEVIKIIDKHISGKEKE